MDTSAAYFDLDGKIACVIGGSRGIGAQTAKALAGCGVKVAVVARDPAAIGAIVDEIAAAGGQAMGAAGDATDYASIEAARHRIQEQFGPVDVLAAFVASGGARPRPLAEVEPDDWRDAIDGTLTSTFLTIRSFLPTMLERRRGSIITMSSLAGRVPGTGAPAAYSVAKAGVQMLTRQAAVEAAPHGVRVNCLAPATILTERTRQHLTGQVREQLQAQHLLGRLGEPEDVAAAALFLASDASSWITGTIIDVAGGQIIP